MIVRKFNMFVLVLLVLTAGVSSYMSDRFMDEPHVMKRNLPQPNAVMCGRPRKYISPRSAIGPSSKYMGEMPNLGNNVNDVTHVNDPVSDVPDMDTHVNYVSNADRYVFDMPPLNTGEVDKLNLNTYMDDDSMIDKNTSDEPEADEHVSDDSDLDKIIGGRFATRGEAPWQARIEGEETAWGWRCGSSIISEFWILTAAHCLKSNNTKKYQVFVGDYSRSRKDPEEQRLDVETIIKHENYKFAPYDIGLIKIKPQSNGRGIIFGKYVQPVCLPIGDSTPRYGTEMIFTGWGDEQSGSPDILKLTILPLISKRVCFFNRLSSDMFCAGENFGSSEGCSGDSGGALVYKKEGIYIQYGVASRAHGCPLPNMPVVFINVSFHVSWIVQTIKKNSVSIDEQRIPDRPQSMP